MHRSVYRLLSARAGGTRFIEFPHFGSPAAVLRLHVLSSPQGQGTNAGPGTGTDAPAPAPAAAPHSRNAHASPHTYTHTYTHSDAARSLRPDASRTRVDRTTVEIDRTRVSLSMNVKMHASLVTLEDLRHIAGASLRHTRVGKAGTSGVGVVASISAHAHAHAQGEGEVDVGQMVLLLDTPGCWTSGTVEVEVDLDTGAGAGAGAGASAGAGGSSKVIALPAGLTFEQAAVLPDLLAAWALLRTQDTPPVPAPAHVSSQSGSSSSSSSSSSLTSLKPGDIVITNIGATSSLGRCLSLLGAQHGVQIAHNFDKVRGAQLAVSMYSGKGCTDLSRRLGSRGTLVVVAGPLSPELPPAPAPASVGSASLPVAAAIFNGVSVEGFCLGAWVQQHPTLAKQAVAALAHQIITKKLDVSTIAASCVTLEQFVLAVQRVEAGHGAVLSCHASKSEEGPG